MDIAASRAAKIVVFSLIATVILQLVYMVSLGGPSPLEEGSPLTNADVIRYFDQRGGEITAVWGMEALAFLIIAAGSFFAASRGLKNGLAWVALGLAGVFNTVQIGIGLSMFEPAARVGGDDSGLFFLFVSGAFFFYYVAKVLIGVAGLVLGMHLFKDTATGAKALGGITAIAGLASIAANGAAMALGNPVLLIAGATGTLATLFVAIAAGKVAKRAR